MNSKFAEVLTSLKNSKPTEITPFAEFIFPIIKDQLKRLNEEIKLSNEKTKQDTEASSQLQNFRKAKMALLFDQVYRIKRFLLIYFSFRCDRIDEQFWHYGGDLNNNEKQNLSDQEKKYFTNYKAIVMDYIEEVGVDLTIDLEPPLEYEVEVTMLKDCGEILDQHGKVVKLEKHSGNYMKKKLIQTYAKQGLAKIRKN